MVELLLLLTAPVSRLLLPPLPLSKAVPRPLQRLGKGSQWGSLHRERLPGGRLRRPGTHPDAGHDAACAQGLASPAALRNLCVTVINKPEAARGLGLDK